MKAHPPETARPSAEPPVPAPPPAAGPTLLRRVAVGVAGLAVAALTGIACVLSFDDLRMLAVMANARTDLAYLYPAAFDALLVTALITFLLLSAARPVVRLQAAFVLFLLLACAAGANVAVVAHVVFDSQRGAVVLAVLPWAMLLLGVWLLLLLARHAQVRRAALGAPARAGRDIVPFEESREAGEERRAPAGPAAETAGPPALALPPAVPPAPAPEPERTPAAGPAPAPETPPVAEPGPTPAAPPQTSGATLPSTAAPAEPGPAESAKPAAPAESSEPERPGAEPEKAPQEAPRGAAEPEPPAERPEEPRRPAEPERPEGAGRPEASERPAEPEGRGTPEDAPAAPAPARDKPLKWGDLLRPPGDVLVHPRPRQASAREDQLAKDTQPFPLVSEPDEPDPAHGVAAAEPEERYAEIEPPPSGRMRSTPLPPAEG